ncbi:MAG TPA: hypothetical protein VNA25_18350 [Phycisphaerae bacterium]|nr:hypothetical protein [Phycisphaerae bacterium]
MSEREKILSDLSAYLDGELPAASAERIEARLREDAELAVEMERLRRTRELVRGLPRRSAPAEFVSDVLDQAERLSLVSAGGYAPQRPFAWVRYAAAAAVLLIAAGVGIVVGTMLWTGPGPTGTGRHPIGPIAITKDADQPAKPDLTGPLHKDAMSRDASLLDGMAKAGKTRGLDGAVALTNNEVIYATDSAFDVALNEVADVLITNGVQPAVMAKQGAANGGRQVQFLVYVEPQQGRQVQHALAKVRARQTAPQALDYHLMQAEAPTGDAVARAELVAAGRTATTQPCKGVTPTSPARGTEGVDQEGAEQRLSGLAGNNVMIRPPGQLANDWTNTVQTAQREQPATQPAVGQHTVNAQLLLITLKAWTASAATMPTAAQQQPATQR